MKFIPTPPKSLFVQGQDETGIPGVCTHCRPFEDQTRIWLEIHALCVALNLINMELIEIKVLNAR